MTAALTPQSSEPEAPSAAATIENANTSAAPSLPGDILRTDDVPGCKRVVDAVERGRELGEVAQEQRPHRVRLDPVDALGRVDLGPIVAREETVGLDPARRHQDEDPKGGVAEPEALGLRLGVHADHGVDLFRVAVDPAQV